MKSKLNLKKETVERLGNEHHYGGTNTVTIAPYTDGGICGIPTSQGGSCEPCCFPLSAINTRCDCNVTGNKDTCACYVVVETALCKESAKCFVVSTPSEVVAIGRYTDNC